MPRMSCHFAQYFCANKKCDARKYAFADQSMIDKATSPKTARARSFVPNAVSRSCSRFDRAEVRFAAGRNKFARCRPKRREIDKESTELILVGHAYSIAAEAGQVYRGFARSDHGIDGEIEFKDNEGRLTGKKLFLQLKTGDTYGPQLRGNHTISFPIKNAAWLESCQRSAHPVMLVVRMPGGKIWWMDLTEFLKLEGDGSTKAIQQIDFAGERLDVMSVRRWRDRILANTDIERRLDLNSHEFSYEITA